MQRHDERGALAVWASIVLVAFVLVLGIGVDSAGHARAEQEARAVAAEAARAGGQHLLVSDGTAPGSSSFRAEAAARDYAAASNLTALVSVGSGTITVEVSGNHQTSFLGFIGINTLPVRATGSATVTHVVTGEVR